MLGLTPSSKTVVKMTVPSIRLRLKDIREKSNEGKEDVCTICLKVYEHDDYPSRIEHCMHPFCLSCILEWFNVSKSCPVCKIAVERY